MDFVRRISCPLPTLFDRALWTLHDSADKSEGLRSHGSWICFAGVSHQRAPTRHLSGLPVSAQILIHLSSNLCPRLYGVTCLQAFFYYQTYVDDRRFLKVTVSLLFTVCVVQHPTSTSLGGPAGWTTYVQVALLLSVCFWTSACAYIAHTAIPNRTLETVHVALSIWLIDYYLVENYANSQALQSATWYDSTSALETLLKRFRLTTVSTFKSPEKPPLFSLISCRQHSLPGWAQLHRNASPMTDAFASSSSICLFTCECMTRCTGTIRPKSWNSYFMWRIWMCQWSSRVSPDSGVYAGADNLVIQLQENYGS